MNIYHTRNDNTKWLYKRKDYCNTYWEKYDIKSKTN